MFSTFIWFYFYVLVCTVHITIMTASPIPESWPSPLTSLQLTNETAVGNSSRFRDRSIGEANNNETDISDDLSASNSTESATTENYNNITDSNSYRNDQVFSTEEAELTASQIPDVVSNAQTSTPETELSSELNSNTVTINGSSTTRDVSLTSVAAKYTFTDFGFTTTDENRPTVDSGSQGNHTRGTNPATVSETPFFSETQSSSSDNQIVNNIVNTSNNNIRLDILLQNDEETMLVSWLLEPKDTKIFGFHVTYEVSGGESYDSSLLDKTTRTFTLHGLHKDESYIICVAAMADNITVAKDACADWSEPSLKIVMGILAGVIFLVPCFIIALWILRKDRKMKISLELIDDDDDNVAEHRQLVVSEKTMREEKSKDEKAHGENIDNLPGKANEHTTIETEDKSIKQQINVNVFENPCMADIITDEKADKQPEDLPSQDGGVNRSTVSVRL